MKIPLIKICGVTRAEDIYLCEDLLIDYIGLNFVPSSPRYLQQSKAAELRPYIKRALTVGVFVDEKSDQVQKIATDLNLDYVQLHGGESIDYINQLEIPVIKAFRTVPERSVLQEFVQAGAKIMLDGRFNGEKADWETIGFLPQIIKDQLFVAGGLNPENVREAIGIINPFAVDCASGVEISPGVKDKKLLAEFVMKVRYGEIN